MHNDLGVAVAPAVLDSPLWLVSDRALRVYIALRAKVVRVAGPHTVEGVTVSLQPGEVLLSLRVLLEVVGGGMNQLIRALRELEHVHLIHRQPVARVAVRNWKRKRFRSESASVSNLEAPERFRSGTTGRIVVTRFKLPHVNQLPEKRSASRLETKVIQERTTSSPLTDRERSENARAFAMLVAEGR